MKRKIISIIILMYFFGCTGVLEPESLSENIYISAQGFDQINILQSIEGEIQSEQNIISVNFMENMMDTPHFVEIDEINNLWFVTLINSGKVLMYDLNSNEMLDSIVVGDSPALMTHDANQKRLYISRMMPMNGMMGMPESESNKIQVLDYSNQEFVKITDFELPAPAPHGLDISNNGEFLFVASNTSDWVYKVNTESGEIVNEIFITDPNSPLLPETEINYNKPIQLKYFDGKVFLTCSAGKFYNGQTEENIPGKIMILSSEDLHIITSYNFEWHSTPWHIAIDEENSELFVAFAGDMGNMGSAGIAHLSFQNNDFIHHWTTTGVEFSTCHGVAISKKYNQVYLSGRGNGILHSLNKNDGSILQSINVLMDNHNHDHGGHSHGAMLGGIAVH